MSGLWSNCCCGPRLESKFIYVARPWGQFWTEYDVAATEAYFAGGGSPDTPIGKTGHMDVRYLVFRESIVGTYVVFGELRSVDALIIITYDPDHGWANTEHFIDGVAVTAVAYVAALNDFNHQDGPTGGGPETLVQGVTPTTVTAEHSATSDDGFGGYVDYLYVRKFELQEPITLEEQMAKCEADMGEACTRRLISGWDGAATVAIDYCFPSEWATPLTGADSSSSGILLRPKVTNPSTDIYANKYSDPWDGVYSIASVSQTYPGWFQTITPIFPTWFRGIPAAAEIATIAGNPGYFQTDALKLDGGSYRMRYGDGTTDEGLGDCGALKSCWSLPAGYGCGITANNGEQFNSLDVSTGWLAASVCLSVSHGAGIYVFESGGANGWANHGGLTFGTEPTCCP